ncbi:MAG: hypothetical protein V1793_09400 [Pseudomonadota bacterium]
MQALTCFRFVIVFVFLGSLSFQIFHPAGASGECGPLGSPDLGETVVTASTTAELQNAINTASGPKTIFLESGIYPVTAQSWIMVTKPDITIRSLSGNRDDVIIQGQGQDVTGGFGIQVYDSRVTLADITIRDVGYHAIQVSKTAGKHTDDLLFHNVRCVDTGQQLFKSSGGDMDNGIIECSVFEYTTTLHQGSYTNGIDLVGTHGWIIRDNIIRNIKAAEGLAGPAILIWPANTGMVSSDTIIERNFVIDCDMGIFFGNSSDAHLNHSGGIIRNNFIKGYSGSDAGMGLVRCENTIVANNTIYSPGGLVNWSIETRYPQTTGCYLINNLTDKPILDRDSGTATRISNFDGAVSGDFVSAATGDLHLASRSSTAIVDAGTATSARLEDIDQETVLDGKVDIGADEFNDPGTVYKAYIPHITSGSPDWKDYLQVNNSGASDSWFELVLYGNGIQVFSRIYTVAAFSHGIIDLKDESPAAETGVIRYGDQGLAFRLSMENDGGGIAEFLLGDSLYSCAGLYFSDFSPSLASKGAVIANMGESPCNVVLYAIGQGGILDVFPATINSREKIVGTYDVWFPEVLFGQIQEIAVASTNPSLCGFVISGNASLSHLLFTPAAPVPCALVTAFEAP